MNSLYGVNIPDPLYHGIGGFVIFFGVGWGGGGGGSLISSRQKNMFFSGITRVVTTSTHIYLLSPQAGVHLNSLCRALSQ